MVSLSCAGIAFSDQDFASNLVQFAVEVAEDIDKPRQSRFVVKGGEMFTPAELEQFANDLERLRQEMDGDVQFSGMYGLSLHFRVVHRAKGRISVSVSLSHPHSNWEVQALKVATDSETPYSFATFFVTEQSQLISTIADIRSVLRALE